MIENLVRIETSGGIDERRPQRVLPSDWGLTLVYEHPSIRLRKEHYPWHRVLCWIEAPSLPHTQEPGFN